MCQDEDRNHKISQYLSYFGKNNAEDEKEEVKGNFKTFCLTSS
jgi:hypothetical protein